MDDNLDYGIFGSKGVASPSLFDGRDNFNEDFGFDMNDGGYDLPSDMGGFDGDNFGDEDNFGNSNDSQGWDDFDTSSDNTNRNDMNSDNESQNPKKIAIAAIIMGLVLIIIVMLAIRITGNIGNNTEIQNQAVQQQTNDEVTNQVSSAVMHNGYEQQQVNNVPVQNIQVESNNTYQTEGSTNNGWVEISDKHLAFNNTEQSTFTVERVMVYAKQNGNETNVKAVAVGTITGLTGKYELEIPYQGLENLVIGTVLNIEYSYLTSGNTKVIGTVKFI